ncbi:alpha-isopropylmalate synthase regulatory domain-containing protein [Aliagarivorans marinus]|uniref:alpha-isopropylmalate synthase regulatory domain-containing protein n=1 Tax=Aliagarivorans marinus TaxID=561965 RepID=UPI000412DFCB|nr:alpha-isopropylmalate synthase regulatory domain-containing protein [Aliagarivorans marinus]
MEPNRSIEIMDTTLRDGEQTHGVSYFPEEKVSIGKALLQNLKVDRIEVASARISDGEQAAVKKLTDWASDEGLVERIEILGFVDGNKSVDWIVDAGAKVINLLTKGSLNHCQNQLKKSLEQHLADIAATIDYAKTRGLTVNVYLEDWSNGYADSPEYVYALMEGLLQHDIQHYMLPDTLGVMTPDEVFASLSDMQSRFPSAFFDFHPHNDYGLATANAMAAARAGVSALHCTMNCLGERAGNASLAEVVVVLKDKMGFALQVNEKEIHNLAKLVESFSGKRLAANAPIVGADVFTQTAGIHADGDQKGNLYHTELSPERFGRERSYALGKMAGKASVLKNLEAMDIELSAEDQKKLLSKVVQLGDQKATITPYDLPFIIADIMESNDFSHIELLNCSITSGLELESSANIRLRVLDEIYKSSGHGNGGFDAFMKALQEPLASAGIEMPELLDFEVRIPPGGQTNALTECVITWQGQDASFRSRGVHANQVFAAVQATLRMLNVRLHRQVEGPSGR